MPVIARFYGIVIKQSDNCKSPAILSGFRCEATEVVVNVRLATEDGCRRIRSDTSMAADGA